MTHFVLTDEFEREFEALEEHPQRHAAAVAMYVLTGQRCAQRMTDGQIPQQVITKIFAAWPKAMVAAATADLCALGRWTESDGGGLCFVDWDLTQWTREQETARRAKHAKRNRDYRARKKKAESGEVTHHETVHEVRHVTVPSSSSSSSLNSSTSTSPIQRHTPSSRSAVRADDPVFVHWLNVMGKASTAKPTKDRLAKIAARRREGYSDADLMAAIDGCKLSPFHMGENDRGTAYNDLATILRNGKTVDAHRELLAQGGPKPIGKPRLVPTRGTTAEDFADAPSIEEQTRRHAQRNIANSNGAAK